MPHCSDLIAVGRRPDAKWQAFAIRSRSRYANHVVWGIQTGDGRSDQAGVSQAPDHDSASADDSWTARCGDVAAFSHGPRTRPDQARLAGQVLQFPRRGRSCRRPFFWLSKANLLTQACYVASMHPTTDWQLIASAATACNAKGLTIPVPHFAVRILSRVVDAIPGLRKLRLRASLATGRAKSGPTGGSSMDQDSSDLPVGVPA